MTTSKRKPKQPIAAHPMFPAVVALWFAALFGLGSLAVPAAMLEAVVDPTGLAAFVPAAAPPLGFTARLLVALALTTAGCGIGLVLGLRLKARAVAVFARRQGERTASSRRSPTIRARDAHPDAAPRMPLSLDDDLLLDEPFAPAVPSLAGAQPAPRRRALALQDEGLPIADPAVILNGEDLLDRQSSDGDEFVLVEVAELPGRENAYWTEVDEMPESAGFAPDFGAPLPRAAQVSRPTGFAEQLPREPVAHGHAPASAPLCSPVGGMSLDEMGLVQLVERLGLALAARNGAAVDGADGHAVQGPTAPPPLPASPAPFSRPLFVSVDQPLPRESGQAQDRHEADLPDLAVISPLATRAVRSAPVPLEPSRGAFDLHRDPFHAGSFSDDGLEDEIDDPALSRFLSGPAADHAAFRNHVGVFDAQGHSNDDGHDEEDGDDGCGDEEGTGPSILPDGSREDGYSSLTDMWLPLPRVEFVRVDEPEEPLAGSEPVVIFPGHEPRSPAPFDPPPAAVGGFGGRFAAGSGRAMPGIAMAPMTPAAPSAAPDPEEADRALRAALATLQRMTAQG